MRKTRLLMAMALSLCPLSQGAAQPLDPANLAQKYRASLDGCYAGTPLQNVIEACRSIMSNQCQSVEQGGSSTIGIVSCVSAETVVWDQYLNAEYQATMAMMTARDVETARTSPADANAAAALQNAQRAWIGFRDTECLSEYAAFGTGSMRSIAHSACVMDLTAERAVDLRLKREPGR